MTKPFKTYKEQIAILKKRNLKIVDEAKAEDVLSKINYYNIINGYKYIFLKRDLNGNLVKPEEYKDNASFDELHSLYMMDSELKKTIFPYILRFEKLIKTSCAYHFSKAHQESYPYLQMKNYSDDLKDLDYVLKNISALSNLVSSNNKHKYGKPAVKHYITKHSEIPLWVLVNFLTLGNVSYFYSSLTNALKSTIAKDFSTRYKRDYNTKEKVEEGEMREVLKITNLFRNVIAHDEVLYSFKIHKSSSTTKFTKFFVNEYQGKSLYDLIMILKLVLPKEEHEDLIEDLKRIFNQYSDKFTSVNFDEIIKVAGFIKNWEQM